MSDELFDGHRVERCPGKWINVGTLRDPWKQICNTCRAARQRPADEDDDGDVVDVINAAEIRQAKGLAQLQRELEDEQDREFDAALDRKAYPSGMQMLGGCLIVLALGAAIGIIVFVKVTGGQF